MRKPNYSPTYQESSSSRRTWLHLTLDEGFQISHLHQARILLFILLPVVIFIGKKEGLLCRNFPSFVATILYFYLTCVCLGKLVSFFFFLSFPVQISFYKKEKKKTNLLLYHKITQRMDEHWVQFGAVALWKQRQKSKNDEEWLHWISVTFAPSFAFLAAGLFWGWDCPLA